MTVAEGRSIPCIALTGYVSTGEQARALEAGFEVLVAKPVEAAELAGIVAKLVGRENARS